METMFALLADAPSYIQIVFAIVCLVGIWILYKFKYIVMLLVAGAIAVYVSITKSSTNTKK